jgi:hypothetical protein
MHKTGIKSKQVPAPSHKQLASTIAVLSRISGSKLFTDEETACTVAVLLALVELNSNPLTSEPASDRLKLRCKIWYENASFEPVFES